MTDATTLSLSIVVSPEAPSDAAAVERLVARAFGPGRFARSAYRLRERAAPLPGLSFVARVTTLLVGSNRMTPILAGEVPALFLGPLTVDPAFQRRGVAAALMRRTLETATAEHHGLVVLVGDEPYYGRFGFARVPAGRLTMPGPVDAARLLYRELVPGRFDAASGPVTAGS